MRRNWALSIQTVEGGKVRYRLLGYLLSVALIVSSCTSDPSDESLSPVGPSSNEALTPGGMPLSSLGIRNGPANFSLPSGISLSRIIDQEANVTLVVEHPDSARQLYDYLRDHLEQMGWTIEAISNDAIVFSSSDWRGAYAMNGSESAGLTLRSDASDFQQVDSHFIPDSNFNQDDRSDQRSHGEKSQR